jgi:hypothetical protein
MPHEGSRDSAPDDYTQELLDFFARALGLPSPATGDDEPFARGEEQPATKPPPGDIPPSGERAVAPPIAMMIALAVVPLAMVGLLIPFQLRWGPALPQLPADRPVLVLLGFFAVLLAGLPLHETIHLAGYYLVGRVSWGTARFGPGGSGLALRVQCDRPVRARAYRLILLLPTLLLSLVPGIAGVIIGSWPLVIWAVWTAAVAGSDMAALWAMRGLPADTLVRAHPRRPGCEILPPDKTGQNIDTQG